jgi:hypothetical protein
MIRPDSQLPKVECRMLRKSAPVRIQRLNGESTMSTSGSENRRGILRTIPQEREYPDPRTLPAQPSWQQPRPQLTLSELIPGKYVSATARIVYLKTSERHDAPNFIKEFQTELLYRLFDCKDSAEVISKGYDNALLLVTKTIDKVMTSEIPLKDLVVSKMLRQDLTQYRSLFPHVSAALQLTEAGKSLIRGDIIQRKIS